eukprot:COSAG02_NODE_10718_length_1874_cov_1.505915_2_plen_92_part_00
MPRGKSVRGVRGTKSGGGPRQKKGQDAVKQNRAGKTVNISAKPRHVQVRQPNPQGVQATQRAMLCLAATRRLLLRAIHIWSRRETARAQFV